MKKKVKVWIKQEKQLVKLLYKKGFIDLNTRYLYWDSFKPYKRVRKKRKNKYKDLIYLPELFYGVRDYWGEWDDVSIVDSILESFELYLEEENGLFTIDQSLLYKDRVFIIKYLRKLPTTVNDNKINSVLKIKMC